MNLETRPVVVEFTNDALTLGSDINFHSEGRIVLHIKYVRLRSEFVLNDMRDGQWGAEQLLLECVRVPGTSGLTVVLALDDAARPTITLPGASPIVIDQFDLRGPLTAVAPPVIAVATSRKAAAATGEPPAKRRMASLERFRSLEEAGIAVGLDASLSSDDGFYIEGWIDDRRSALAAITMVDFASGEHTALPFGRVRRPDVEAHLAVGHAGELGFWVVGSGGVELLETAALSFVFEDGTGVPLVSANWHRKSRREFFEVLLASFGRRHVIGNITARSFNDLDAGYGDYLRKMYKQLSGQRRIAMQGDFGLRNETPLVSLVCVIYGRSDFLYLLASQFARFGTLEDFEFIFVSNSPELEEVLARDAELASLVFGVQVRVIGMNQNSGFSYANNVGVAAARADTIAIVNPDVFPRSAAAVRRLRQCAVDPLDGEIVGGKLYYADGSVMHEGMYFNLDRKLTMLCNRPVWTVEHFRKGFSDSSEPQPREVPAISGALMILKRAMFEQMNGFNTDFIFGHYEDADLCLRVKQGGGRVLVDPALAYWHYEGVGSAKKPEHIGSGLYNRWRFGRTWGQQLLEFENA